MKASEKIKSINEIEKTCGSLGSSSRNTMGFSNDGNSSISNILTAIMIGVLISRELDNLAFWVLGVSIIAVLFFF